jgi:hypothetical protein
MQRDGVASHLIVVVSEGMLETRRVARCADRGDLITVAVHVTDLAT